MTVAERCAKLRRMAEIILARKEEIALIDALDVGKPYHSAVLHEVPRSAKNISFFADFMNSKAVKSIRWKRSISTILVMNQLEWQP